MQNDPAFAEHMKAEQAPSQEDMYKRERELRGDYGKEAASKAYADVRDAYERVMASGKRAMKDTTGASDMALIFNYMKMLDPGSAVRETEFANAALAGGYGSRIQNLVANIKAGKLLTPEVRSEFIRTAEAIYLETSKNVSDLNERYTGISKQYGVDPSRVVVSPEQYDPFEDLPQAAPGPAPKAKTITREDGTIVIQVD